MSSVRQGPLVVASVAVETASAEETRRFGADVAGAARAGDRVALIGALGAGKTQFAKGFAMGLGVVGVVNSPSFTLMAEHAGRLPLFHQDLYRLAGAEEALAGGLFDERQDAGVTLTEWADRLGGEIGEHTLEVRFHLLGEEERRLILVAPLAHQGHDYLARAAAWAARRT